MASGHWAFVLLAIASCREPNTPPPSPPIVLATQDGGAYEEPFDTPSGYRVPGCARSCENLRKRNCPEGITRVGEDSCYVVCRRAEETSKIDFNTSCVEKAETQEAIRACGTYRCLQPDKPDEPDGG